MSVKYDNDSPGTAAARRPDAVASPPRTSEPLDVMKTRLIYDQLPAFIVVSVIGGMTQAIYAQTSLVFLGIVPLNNNWGVLFSLAYSRNAIYDSRAAWSLLAPMGAIILLQLSLVLLSRGLEEAFNPRLRTER